MSTENTNSRASCFRKTVSLRLSCVDLGRRRGRELLILILELIELPIDASHRQELLVTSGLSQPAFVHDKNAIGPLNGRETMRDDDRSSSRYKPAKRFPNPDLGFGVHAGCGFVKHEN